MTFHKFVFVALQSLILIMPISSQAVKLLPPASGAYHGAFPDSGLGEDQVSIPNIKKFTEEAGKGITWAYFSNHWLQGQIRFPAENVQACKKAGVIPYIRIQPWSEMNQNRPDPVFTMQRIIDGRFDDQIRAWAQGAKAAEVPIMIEFGPEVNGDWFPWNGKFNGAGKKDGYGDKNWPDGPERFRDAYRHLIDIFRSVGANNITWILHVDSQFTPHDEWNQVKYYYPGDDYIDWIGISVFGAQLPEHDWLMFSPLLSDFTKQLNAATTKKPWMISEFAVIERKPNAKAEWIREALSSISSGKFPKVKGISYWHSPGWLSNKRANFMIDSSQSALDAYRGEITKPFWTVTPVFSN
jgi:hypothetical protein